MQEFNVKINCQILDSRTRSTTLRFTIFSPDKMMIPAHITNNEELHHYLFGDSATDTSDDLTEEGTELFTFIEPLEGEVQRTLRSSLGPMPFVSDDPPRVLHFYQTKTIVVLRTFLISIEGYNSSSGSGSNSNSNSNSSNSNSRSSSSSRRSRSRRISSNSNSNSNSNLPTKNIAANAENAIMYDTINHGNIMANFHDEFQRGRYYKKANVQRLLTARNPVNPHTREPLKRANITYYTAKMSGGRRHSTMSRTRRATRKTRKTRYHVR